MSLEQPSDKLVSRRALLRAAVFGAATAAGSAVLAACGAPQPTASAPTSGAAAVGGTTAPAQSVAGTATPPAKAGQVVNMTFVHFFNGVLWTGSFKHLVEQFEKENPTIKWTGIEVPYSEMMTKTITLAAGGQPPDGPSLDNDTIRSVILPGLLKELGPYVTTDALDLKDFYQARLDANMQDGKLYALPIDMGSGAIYYNKDMFDAAGLKYPDPKWTYDDILATAQKLTLDKSGKHADDAGFDAKNIKQYGFQFQTAPYRFYNLARGFSGAEYFDKDITKTRFNEPPTIKAMQWFADLRNKYHVAPSPAQDQAMRAGGIQPFTSGAWAMEHTWIGLIAYLHEEGVKVKNWDVVNLPETPTAAQEVGGQGFVILNQAKNADAAWKWTKYMAGDEVQKFLGVNGVWFPSRKSMAQYGLPKDRKPEHFMQAFYDQVDKHGVAPWWFVPGWSQWQDIITNEFDAMWAGSKPPQAVAATIQQKLDPLVKDWRAKLKQG